MIAIGAMSLFMTLGWNSLGGWGGCVTAIFYGMLALALTHWFLERKHLEIPAGIMATLAVVTVPLAIGLAIIALGVMWQRREAQWAASVRRYVPRPLRELIEARAVP